MKTILHLCADVGSDSEPYKKAGYNVIRIGQKEDIRKFIPPENVYGIIANPPCTMFSFARTNAKKKRDLREGMDLVKECLRVIWECQYRIASDTQKKAPLSFWVLENPNAMLKWFLGKPAMIYSPHEFGDTYKKTTCLWGQFNEPLKTPVDSTKMVKFDRLLTKEIHPEYYGKLTRTERRSVCSAKFAEAFFKANQ